jgi:hypothetical protein
MLSPLLGEKCFMANGTRKINLESPLHIAPSKQRTKAMLGDIEVDKIPEDT